jgi:hypothetical protein
VIEVEDTEEVCERVRIVADLETRNRLWRLLSDPVFNPVADFSRGRSDTVIVLTSFEGYERGGFVPNIAWSAAELAAVGDWNPDLLERPARNLHSRTILMTDVIPDQEFVQRHQRLYIARQAIQVLKSLYFDLQQAGRLNTSVLRGFVIAAEDISCPMQNDRAREIVAQIKAITSDFEEKEKDRRVYHRDLRHFIESFEASLCNCDRWPDGIRQTYDSIIRMIESFRMKYESERELDRNIVEAQELMREIRRLAMKR